MSISIRGSNNSSAAFTTGAVSITLPVTTNTSDCIVVTFGATPFSSAGALTASGAGATWMTVIATEGSNQFGMAIGYGCSAGNTTCTVSSTTSTEWFWCAAVLSGTAYASSPVAASSTGGTASGNTAVTGTVGYAAGDLVVGTGGSNTNGGLSVVWGGGASNTRLQTAPSFWATWDYITVGASGSTFLDESISGGGTVGAAVAVLTPPPAAGTALWAF